MFAVPAAQAIPGGFGNTIIQVKNNPLILPIAVFGKDNRSLVPKKYTKQKNQIGLLFNPATNTLCSAFCVAPDVIATASHCLFTRKPGRKLNLSNFVFRLDRRGHGGNTSDTRLAGYENGLTRQSIIAGTSGLNRKPPIGAAKDWALARLAKPSCKGNYLKVKALSNEQLISGAKKKKLFQLAYHLDFRNWRLAYSRPCQVSRNFGKLRWSSIRKQFAQPGALVLHRCDTGGASSGSPLFMETKNGPVVIAINVGTYQQRNLLIRRGKIIKKSRFKTIANTAVNASVFEDMIDELRNARLLASASELKALQTLLKQQNFYAGAIDGIYGSQTEAAIKAFQKKSKMRITGLASLKLLNVLLKLDGRGATTSANTPAGGFDQKARRARR